MRKGELTSRSSLLLQYRGVFQHIKRPISLGGLWRGHKAGGPSRWDIIPGGWAYSLMRLSQLSKTSFCLFSMRTSSLSCSLSDDCCLYIYMYIGPASFWSSPQCERRQLDPNFLIAIEIIVDSHAIIRTIQMSVVNFACFPPMVTSCNNNTIGISSLIQK